MLLPTAALAAALGVGGWLTIHNVVESAHDRLLDGSVLAIAERLTVDEDNEVTVDLSAVPREALAPAVALNALLERLEQSIGTVRRFTADASHQMRTPLTILSTHLGILQRRGIDTPEGRAALEDIEAATRRLERLLAPLIALARADEGRLCRRRDRVRRPRVRRSDGHRRAGPASTRRWN
jgi:signal transduction histidine kinase